jgi:predicted RNA-binding Zn ribbon-like protein
VGDPPFEPSDLLAFTIRLAQSWDESEDDPELLQDAGGVGRFLRQHGLDDAAGRADDDDLRALRRLRDRLADVWDAPSEGAAVALLNELAGEQPLRPRLVRRGAGWEHRYDPPGAKVRDFAQALTAAALMDAIAEGGWPRFGRCLAAPCRCVYVDRSRGGVRKYCSTRCADRMAHRAFRRRARRTNKS